MGWKESTRLTHIEKEVTTYNPQRNLSAANFVAEEAVLPVNMLQSNVKLSQFSNYKIGGNAGYFFEAKNTEEIISALAYWRSKSLAGFGKRVSSKNLFILGGGTNILVDDKGFNGLVLKPGLVSLSAEDCLIKAGSGVAMKDLLDFAAERGLSGLEWAGGLPGTLGGAIRGNAGAFSGEIKDSVFEVTSLDISRKTPRVIERLANECGFGYRTSIFKEHNGKEIILEASLALKKGDPKVIKAAADEKIAFRNARHPMDYPSIGSIFKNVDLRLIPKRRHKEFEDKVKADPFPVVPVAYLLAESGLRGVSFGGAMISPKHPNFIVNVLAASSNDVKALIKLAKATIKERFDIGLEEEIIYL